ncbi:MAG: CRISPR-associated endonuclease Cas1 [Gammaproteobacteria bacterium]|uniref:CRISPR-associated protein Cas1 n=1 Tax=hydrothermal vent metagenome TaxID=652676 RepID=A0A1W1E1W1_9ZZZZ|nr:CRISPR-associated endonuclease Cas1 [Gammaproteobacteria bacterium]
MHAHLTLSEYGQFIGVTSECLTVKHEGFTREYPLNRLKSVQIAKRGVSFSSDVIIACANRGIKFFIQDFKNEAIASLSGTGQHAVVKVRQKQFKFVESEKVRQLAPIVIAGKIKNQRATLLYFKKYHQQHKATIDKTAEQLNSLLTQIKYRKWQNFDKWSVILLGLEGQAATQYWQCLVECDLMPNDFKNRIGRQAQDVGNKALNYGYAILTSYIWNAILNAGLEPYCGFFHTVRAGKPSLVLDIMEEYRAWVVDRNIIKLRTQLAGKNDLTPAIKKKIITDIHKTFNTKYHYKKRKMRLESILQRQVYHLAGHFSDDKKYKSYRFRW